MGLTAVPQPKLLTVLGVLWGLSPPHRNLGHLVTTPLPPPAPPSFSCPSPLHLTTAPLRTHSVPLSFSQSRVQHCFYFLCHLAWGTGSFWVPLLLSSCHSLSLCSCACAFSSEQASVPGWGSRLFMNQENCFSVSKAKFELVFLGSLHPPSWVGDGEGGQRQECPFLSPVVQ